MIWLATAWRWFLSTTLGRWIVGVGAALAAVGALVAVSFLKGKHAQAAKDEAQRAKETAESAQMAQDVYRTASDAATKVQADAAKQAAPNTVKRDDFDTSF